MSNPLGLEPWEERYLDQLARGRDKKGAIAEAAAWLGVSAKTMNNRLAERHTWRKVGAETELHAVANYANWLGMRGEILFYSERPEQTMTYACGTVRYLACVISSPLRNLRCLVAHDTYQPPPDFPYELNQLCQEYEQSRKSQGKTVYNDPLFAVRSIEGKDETFADVTLRLDRTHYYTYRVMVEQFRNKNPALQRHSRVNPYMLRNSPIPIALDVFLHIIVGNDEDRGNPPQLIFCRRGSHLDTGAGYLSAAVGAHGNPDVDCGYSEDGQRVFDYAATMFRELGEEMSLTPQRFRDNLNLLALIYDYREIVYVVCGYVWLKGRTPRNVIERLPVAKEGSYDYLPLPARGKMPLAICEHLKKHYVWWSPASAISLIILLEKLYGQDGIMRLLE